MKIIDISGPIYTGMWNYPEPLGSKLGAFRLSSVKFEFGGEKYSVNVFKGVKAQTGTYLETPGHYSKKNDYTVDQINVENLFLIDTYVLKIPFSSLREKDGKRYIDVDDIKNAEKGDIEESAAILIGTGYGSKNWRRADFFKKSWFFKKEAMEYIISKKPFILGADSAEWENPKNPEGIFRIFYPANILILASCINIEKASRFKVKLTVLPFKIVGSYISPARAVITE